MLDITTVVLFFVVFIFTYLYWKSRPPSSLPPGPKGWPFIGHLDLIYYGKKRKFHVITDKWSKEYGGIYNLQCMQIPTVMVTDLDILKEALIEKADVWSDRPLNNDFIKTIITRGVGGVALQNGEMWKKMRRLTVQSMKDFGVGKKSIEEKVVDELNEVIKGVEATKGEAFHFELLFHKAVANVICSVLFGHRYAYDDPNYEQLTRGLNEIFKGSGFQNIFIFMPWYTFWLMPLQPNIRKIIKAAEFMDSFIEKEIKEHRDTFDAENPRDFVDLLLEQENQGESDKNAETRMFQVIGDLFMAGSETSSTTLLWAFLFFIKHPEVQAKCRAQIQQTIGFEKTPSYADRTELPYIEATISEVLRLGNTVSVVIFHNTARTAKLHGYTIPKDTLLMFNLYSIHMNPKLWDDPKAFKPERFLDENGKYKRSEAFLGFGLGKRACLGENLARMELFLFITGLLQKFEFTAEDVSKLPSVDNTSLGLTLIPGDYRIKAKKLV